MGPDKTRALRACQVFDGPGKEMGMKGHFYTAGRNVWARRTLAAFVVAATFPLSALAADRLVLSELFTAES